MSGRTPGRFVADEIAAPLEVDFFIGLPASERGRVSRMVYKQPDFDVIRESIPEQMRQRIQDEYHRLQLVEVQIRELKAKQAEQVRAEEKSAAIEKVQRLQRLIGIGLGSSWIFVMELFGWRQFQNRRELAAAVGLTPTPYNSGDSTREQGISRSGNRRIRKLLIEIAWAWLRFQPDSQLSQWYNERFAKMGNRMRRVGIVALARKLVIALWRYLESGTVPKGAQLKAAA